MEFDFDLDASYSAIASSISWRVNGACSACAPSYGAKAVSIRTTASGSSKSISGTFSRQPVGHSCTQTRQPLQ